MSSTLDIRSFAATPTEADEKFHAACREAGIAPVTFAHPLKGPEGEPLATTIALLGPHESKNVLMVVSGTHGVEGYAGGGVMVQLLNDATSIKLPKDTAVLFVHQINPWGLAWNRRENEDNVDLFRNLLYCDPPYTDNPGFDDLADALGPAAWSGPVREAADRKLASFVQKNGERELTRIMRLGQHKHPKSLTYHGRGPTWSKRVVDRIIDGWLAHASTVTTLDIHTGYGPPGDGLIMSYDLEGSPGLAWKREWFGDVHVCGHDPLIPVHARWPYDIVADRVPGARVRTIALEYGTAEADLLDFDLVRENNYHHLYGDALSPEGRAIQKRFRACFYVETDAWKKKVLKRGVEVFNLSLAGLGKWARV
ncbi:MAG: DUF2817 domain-containing protein [Alphaproteobacteria bacterium]|nr:DUF2817 domain-containing protein [Alphaproteobacteria bacterium]